MCYGQKDDLVWNKRFRKYLNDVYGFVSPPYLIDTFLLSNSKNHYGCVIETTDIVTRLEVVYGQNYGNFTSSIQISFKIRRSYDSAKTNGSLTLANLPPRSDNQ